MQTVNIEHHECKMRYHYVARYRNCGVLYSPRHNYLSILIEFMGHILIKIDNKETSLPCDLVRVTNVTS